MDQVLSDFIERTKVEPSLARDLLEATDWNLDNAVLAYESLNETSAVEPQEYQYNPSKCPPSVSYGVFGCIITCTYTCVYTHTVHTYHSTLKGGHL